MKKVSGDVSPVICSMQTPQAAFSTDFVEIRLLLIYTICTQEGEHAVKRIRSTCGVLSLMLCAPVSVLAQSAWEEGFTRGLSTYSAAGEGGSLIMVCDPDRVYNPDVSYANFVVSMPKDKAARRIVFLASSGQQAAFDVRDGTATQQEADPENWDKLIVMIREGGQFAVVTSQDAFQLDMAARPDFDCK